MKAGWQTKVLEEVCEIEYGTRVVQKRDGGSIYPVYGGGGATFQMDVFNREDRLVIARFGMSESCMRFIGGKFFLNDSGLTISPKIDALMPRFVDYKMLSMSKEIYALGRGTAQKNLDVPSFRTLPFSFPTCINEQQRIVTILDEAFAGIAIATVNAEKNLANARELFESYLNSVFGNKLNAWEEKTLKEVCAKITDGTHQTPKYFDSGVIFLSSRNVTSGKVDWNNIKYIDEKQHLEMHKRVAPRVGDILLAKNGTTGVAAMVDRDVVFDIYVSLAHIRVLDEVTPEFMLYFINSSCAKRQFNKRLKGSGVPNLHLEEIREVVITFPTSIEEQKQIVKKLDELSVETKRLEDIYKQKLVALEELKKSILNQAFSGQLQ